MTVSAEVNATVVVDEVTNDGSVLRSKRKAPATAL
jgi:hypothetical protein